MDGAPRSRRPAAPAERLGRGGVQKHVSTFDMIGTIEWMILILAVTALVGRPVLWIPLRGRR
jgi:hypothetical protein